MKILSRQPTRRWFLRAFVVAAVGAPLAWRVGRFVARPRLVRPEELSAIPWIGHC